MPSSDAAYRIDAVGEQTVLRWPGVDATGVVDAVVTTRVGGVSTGPYESLNLGLHVGDDPDAVLENRARAAATIGLGLDDLVFCTQSHGREVAVIGPAERGRGARAESDAMAKRDALVTTEPGIGLVVMVADCVPIVLVDPVARVLACVHAGWKGTTELVTEAAISVMEKLGASPPRLVAGVGPAVPVARYQVGEDVLQAATDTFGDRAGLVIRPDGTGKWRFDLWAANHLVLTDAGVDPGNIHLAALGTEHELFFSDRLVRPCGRFAAIGALRR